MAEKKDKVAAEPAKKTNAALDAVLSQIKKEFGELSIMRLGGAEHANIPVISTGARRSRWRLSRRSAQNFSWRRVRISGARRAAAPRT